VRRTILKNESKESLYILLFREIFREEPSESERGALECILTEREYLLFDSSCFGCCTAQSRMSNLRQLSLPLSRSRVSVGKHSRSTIHKMTYIPCFEGTVMVRYVPTRR
jgi:hypothetical protein